MRVDEQMLISEGNKILRKDKADQAKAQERRGTSASSSAPPESPHDLFAGPEIGIGQGQKTLSTASDSTLQRSNLNYQEEAFVRLLVLFGRYELEPNISVCSYVLSEIPGVEFADPIYNHILQLFRENFHNKEILSTEYFLNHSEREIREITIGWASQNHELSEQWNSKFAIYVPIEEDVLDKSSFKFILRLKKAFVDEKISKCIEELKRVTDPDKQNTILKEWQKLKAMSMAAAEELGIVVG